MLRSGFIDIELEPKPSPKSLGGKRNIKTSKKDMKKKLTREERERYEYYMCIYSKYEI